MANKKFKLDRNGATEDKHGYFFVPITILGGLPLWASFTVGGAEPDVGIMNNYIEDLCIVDRYGKEAEWATKKLNRKDWDDVEEQCWDGLPDGDDEPPDDDPYDYRDEQREREERFWQDWV